MTADRRTFATGWQDVAIQITRCGRKFEVNVSKVFENGEQDTVALPLTEAQVNALQLFWDRS